MEFLYMEYCLDLFLNGLDKFNISLSDEQISKFILYYEMMIEKNKVMNLTTITEFNEVIEKHFLDSLSLVRDIDLKKNIRVLDLGTGAGFPGIPLKIAFPELRIVLADSLNKRVLFLRDVIEQLKLVNITAIHGRAEELARQREHRERYDLCVSRAVANLSTLSEYCLPFVKTGGCFVPYKSGSAEEELAQARSAIFLLGGKLKQVDKFEIGESSRTLIVIEKVQGCPRQYPRKAGTPSKKPLSK